jgi:aminoglycoside/choline kinase family phosphotransferase
MVQQTGDAAFTIRVIDFQDALMGPCQYDLASLIRDSYIDLPEEVVDSLIQYYVTQWEKQTGETIQNDLFREFFDLISIQRNLKAAGRFVFIDQVKKNPKFLPYVPPTLAKVKRNLEKHRRLKPLQDLLAQYVKELQ